MDTPRQASADISEEIDNDKSEQHNSNHNNPSQNENEKQEDFDQEQETARDKETSEQNELYEKTLKKQESMEKRSRRSSLASTSEHRSNRSNSVNKALTSQSMNFEQKPSKRRSYSNLSDIKIKDPYLSSVNDMKYLGDQFLVGKINPNLKSPFEMKFEKMYSSKLKKLTQENQRPNSADVLATFRQKKDPKILFDPQFTLTNELKYLGDQFKVGKIDPKLQSPVEKRFQSKFKSQLKLLLPNYSRTPKLTFTELKEMHEKLTTPRNGYSKK